MKTGPDIKKWAESVGFTPPDIAKKLKISQNTVNSYYLRMYPPEMFIRALRDLHREKTQIQSTKTG